MDTNACAERGLPSDSLNASKRSEKRFRDVPKVPSRIPPQPSSPFLHEMVLTDELWVAQFFLKCCTIRYVADS